MFDTIKNRKNQDTAKEYILEFMNTRSRIMINLPMDPPMEWVELFNYDNHYYIVVPTFSNYHKQIKSGDVFNGMICDDQGQRSKTYTRISGTFKTYSVEDVPPIKDRMFQKMMHHKMDIFEVKPEKAMAILSMVEMFDLDKEYNPTFAQVGPEGDTRYEYSHMVVMEYNDKNVILNAYINDGVYYALTKKDSNKMEHIQSGGSCRIYDGMGVEFDTVITATDKVEEIYNELCRTNNAYFKSVDGLIGLEFKSVN